MKIFDPKLTGSIEVLNTITGDITLSGNLNVGGNLEGSITGSVTASYIDLANVDGSASLASNISANSASAAALSAATSSYLLNTTDTFTGDLTVTGEVIAQTLHVQQVTSSIVYSSGSNLFGETVADTQKFTGSLQVSGSDSHILGNLGIGTTSPFSKLQVNGDFAAEDNIYLTDAGTIRGRFELNSSDRDDVDIKAVSLGSNMKFFTVDTERMRIDSSGVTSIYSGTLNLGTDSVASVINSIGDLFIFNVDSNNNTGGTPNFRFRIGSTTDIVTINGTGVGIGTTSITSGYKLDLNGRLRAVGAASNYLADFISTESNGSSLQIYADNSNVSLVQGGTSAVPMTFYVSGSEAMRIASNGNVGIGTNSPSTTLNVGHANHGIGMAYLGGDSLPSIAGLFTDNSANGGTGYGDLHIKSRSDYGVYGMFFHTAASNNVPEMRMVIKNDGSIGIGTTTTRARMNFPNIVDTNGYDVGTLRFYDNGDSIFYGIGVSNAQFNLRAGTTSDSFAFWTGTTHRMQIQGTTGNVGIGTDSPTKQLEVKNSYDGSQLTLRSTSGNSGNAGLRFGIADNTVTTDNYHKASIWLTGTGAGNALGALTFNVNGNASNVNVSSADERMRITPNGYLKVSNDGTYANSAGSYHEIITDAGNNTIMDFRNKSAQPYGLYIKYTAAAPNSTNYYYLLFTDSSASSRFIVWSNGNVENQNNSYGAISDAKLKENIVDASPKLDDLMQVKIRNYNLIGDDKKQLGVIAQELEEVFPSMIDESPDFEEQEVIDEEGNVTKERVDLGTTTKSVKYSVFVPMLIKAMQEQQVQIEELKAEIQALKNS